MNNSKTVKKSVAVIIAVVIAVVMAATSVVCVALTSSQSNGNGSYLTDAKSVVTEFVNNESYNNYSYMDGLFAKANIVSVCVNELTSPEDETAIAKSLGLNYNKIVLIGTGLISFAVGIVAAVIWNLPFLGLIVPNIVSMYRGDDLRSNLPWVCVLGMGAITLSDIISRTIIMPFEVPVSLILGTVGAIIFIIILLRQRRPR